MYAGTWDRRAHPGSLAACVARFGFLRAWLATFGRCLLRQKYTAFRRGLMTCTHGGDSAKTATVQLLVCGMHTWVMHDHTKGKNRYVYL